MAPTKEELQLQGWTQEYLNGHLHMVPPVSEKCKALTHRVYKINKESNLTATMSSLNPIGGTQCTGADCSNSEHGPTPPPTPTPSNPAAGVQQFLDALDNLDSDSMDKAMYPTDFTGIKQYKWVDLKTALKFVCNTGFDGTIFYVPDVVTGLVNLASFLGQCMKETIQYNACDENNWSSDPTYGWLGGGGTKLTITPGYSNAQGWLMGDTGGTTVNYPVTAACGQLGQSYEDYDCPDACPKMVKGTRLVAHTQAGFDHHPGPMGTTTNMSPETYNFPPQEHWDDLTKNTNVGAVTLGAVNGSSILWPYCIKSPPGSCSAAQGCPDSKSGLCLEPATPEQITTAGGGWSWLTKLPKNVCVAMDNVAMKGGSNCTSHRDSGSCQSDSQCQWTKLLPKKLLSDGDCNWWGRGVIQTTGRCNFGKLNKAIGSDSKQDTANPYQKINFCTNPEAICDPTSPQALKWIAGLFYWVSEVQATNIKNSFDDTNAFNFHTAIATFISKKGNDNYNFIDAISGLVNRGCPSATACSTGAVDGARDRSTNFKDMLTQFKKAGDVPMPD